MAYRLNSKRSSNWVKASLGLTTTKEAFYDLIENEFKSFADEHDASDHLRCIIANCKEDNIKKGKLLGKTTWTICCGCYGCQTFVDDVAKKHANLNRITWENIGNDNDKDVNVPEHWTTAKLFMPKAGTSRRRVSTGPQAADAVAIFEILKTCKLFDGFDISDLVEMIEVRNNLMHSANLELSSSETDDAFDAMKKLLECDVMQYSIYSMNAIDELEKLRDPSTLFVSSSSERYDMQRKALSLRKESLQYDKDMYRSMGRSFAHFDDMIKKTNEQLNILAGTPAEKSCHG